LSGEADVEIKDKRNLIVAQTRDDRNNFFDSSHLRIDCEEFTVSITQIMRYTVSKESI